MSRHEDGLPAFSLKLTFDGPGEVAPALAEAFKTVMGPLIAAANGVVGADLMSPSADKPVFFDKEPPAPALHVEIGTRTRADAEAIISASEFRDAAAKLASDHGCAVCCGLYQVAHSVLPGAKQAAARTAPTSFLVRYYGPTEDPADFADYYVAHHPPALSKFPNVRNVLCYLPLEVAMGDLTVCEVIIGNEVVFDDVASLNAAMQSGAMREIKADSATFKPFGHSTHHAMVRAAL